jgi:peptide-methionine (S)-S-oxide reductase
MVKRFIYLKVLLISTLLLCSNVGQAQNLKTAYFAGGCFWCMEESFEKIEGVIDVVSGYSGGTTKNPTYKEVTYGSTGHFEVIEIKYDSEKINYKKLLDIFWLNIDPLDKEGQFCDKGYSYRSVAFYSEASEKELIDISIIKLQNKFNKKIVTYVRKFDKFYKAESYHQDYYEKSFINYLRYKKACGRVKTLKKIWN